MKKYILLIIGLTILLTLTACGNANSKTQELGTEISALETQMTGLENALATALVSPTTAPPTASPSDRPSAEITPTPTSTATLAPFPTKTESVASSDYVCSWITLNMPLYQKSYTKSGKLRTNGSGNLILKIVPKNEVQRYTIGEVVCHYKYAMQADGMRVFVITSGRGVGYYIPVIAFNGG